MTDTKALRDAIAESGMKYQYIAEKMGLSTYGLQKKIDNCNEFKASEMMKLASLLNLSARQRDSIFFAP